MRHYWDRPPQPPDPALVAFGELVRAARHQAWMTQRQFGRHVGLDQGSVSRLERGLLRSIRLHRLAPVLTAAGVVSPRKPPADPGRRSAG